MLIRILLLPLSLTLVTIAGALGTLMALFLATAKAFDNSAFIKAKIAEASPEDAPEDVPKAAPPYSGPTVVKH